MSSPEGTTAPGTLDRPRGRVPVGAWVLQLPGETAMATPTVQSGLRGEVLRPGDPGYDDARHVFTAWSTARPP